MRFYDELGFWITLAIGISLFIAGFNPLFKVVVSHAPSQLNGLKEALAASQ